MSLRPPPLRALFAQGDHVGPDWFKWFDSIYRGLAKEPFALVSYTVATVPSAALFTGGLIFISNESGGPCPAYSDGTNWRRVYDAAIIS